jgi:hypothetical protein
MDAVGSGGQGHVNAVIDDACRAVGLTPSRDLFGQLEQVAVGPTLDADLDNVGSTFERGWHGRAGVTAEPVVCYYVKTT